MSEYDIHAETYDFVSKPPDDDVSFYRKLAQQLGGPVLEIGVGTGRVAIELAKAGIGVVGIDNSGAMLKRLRGKLENGARDVADKIVMHEMDMCDFDIPNRFRTIIVPFRAFNHMLTDIDRRRALLRMVAHLAPNGRIAIHTFGPLYHLLAKESRIIPIKRRELPGGRFLIGEDRVHYDHNRKLIEMERMIEVYNGGDSPSKRVLPLKLAYIFPEELTLTAELCGLELDKLIGDFDGRSYSYPDRIEAVHIFKHPQADELHLNFD